MYTEKNSLFGSWGRTSFPEIAFAVAFLSAKAVTGSKECLIGKMKLGNKNF
jgi:hypothetical protein